MTDIMTALALTVLGPLSVGLLLGVDRKLTARMQNRVGPPILQPFYDLVKLFGKERRADNQAQISYAAACLLLQMVAFIIFATGGDLLVAFFVSGAGNLALALGAFSSRSAFGQIGGQRELLQVLAYEPVLFLVIFMLGWWNGSFLSDSYSDNLLGVMILVLVAMMPVVLIVMQKSPFDIATAHQEIVSGVYVEYSGTYLGILELAHWFELAFIFALLTLFYSNDDVVLSIAIKVGIVLAFMFFAILIDNSTARLTSWDMIKLTLLIGIGLVSVNMAAIWLHTEGVF